MRKRGAEVCESGAQHMHGARGVQHEVAVTERQRLNRRQRLQERRAEEKWGSQELWRRRTRKNQLARSSCS